MLPKAPPLPPPALWSTLEVDKQEGSPLPKKKPKVVIRSLHVTYGCLFLLVGPKSARKKALQKL